MKRAFLIKYGEIALKGKNRRIFEDVLVKRIRQALDSVDGTYKIERPRGRIFIEPETGMDELETIEALKCVFGIVAICPVIMVEDEGFEDYVRYGKAIGIEVVVVSVSLAFAVEISTARNEL